MSNKMTAEEAFSFAVANGIETGADLIAFNKATARAAAEAKEDLHAIDTLLAAVAACPDHNRAGWMEECLIWRSGKPKHVICSFDKDGNRLPGYFLWEPDWQSKFCGSQGGPQES